MGVITLVGVPVIAEVNASVTLLSAELSMVVTDVVGPSDTAAVVVAFVLMLVFVSNVVILLDKLVAAVVEFIASVEVSTIVAVVLGVIALVAALVIELILLESVSAVIIE